MKQNLSSILIALCSAIILSISACSFGDSDSSGSDKNTDKTDTPKIDLSKYQEQGEMCPKVTEKEVLDCQKRGGSLEVDGLRQCYVCTIIYDDAGKICSDASECQGECVSYKQIPPNQPNQKGQCKKNNLPFGCYQILRKGVAEPTMCVD